MVQTSAGAGPIPPAKKDDSEDVAWALSTAEAMFARGDRGEALKWLRRAAEAASEGEADDRALELAKAAADLASAIGPVSNPPPAPSRPPPAPAPTAPAPAPPQTAAPAAVTSTPSPRPPPPPAAAARKVASAPAKPLPPARPQPAQRTAMRAAVPFESTGVRPTEARRTRRSRPEISFARQTEEVTESMPVDAIPAPHAPEPRRRRASRPSFDEATPPVAPVIPQPDPPPLPATPRPEATAETTAEAPAIPQRTDEMDAWPTQSRAGDDLADPSDEKTRIGVPAYEASAKLITEGTLAPLESPALRPSQALRVIVWRAADGVHVAPAGTRVGAITVEAVLVALDPAADLASWLSSK
jgi:hypothetical protein